MYNRYLRAHAAPEEERPLPPAGHEKRPPLLSLPGKLETGDLLVILILLLAWLEREDEELLILMAAFAVLSL